MSLAHMPPAFQLAYGVLWVGSVVVLVSLTVAEPLSAPLTPIPQLITGLLAVAVARAVYVELKGWGHNNG